MNKKRIILNLVLIGIMIIFAAFVGGNFPYLFLFITLLIYGYSIYTNRKIKKEIVAIFWSDSNLVEKGEEIELNYKIYNSSILPLVYAEIKDKIPRRLNNESRETNIYFMTPFDTVNINRRIKCQHRGVYDVGVVELTTGDVFGLQDNTLEIKDPLEITVYPKVYNLENFKISGSETFGSVHSKQKYNEDYSSIRDLRKYQYGDSLKRVNWKITARKGELFVNNYDVSTNVEIQLFMDFQLDKYKKDDEAFIEEKIVECVISIVRYALFRKVSTNLTTYTEKKIELRGKDIGGFKEFLELIARVRPTNNINLGDIILKESRTFSAVTTIIIVTPQVDEKLMSSVLTLKEKGYNVLLIVVNDFKNNKAIKQELYILQESGIEIYKIDLEDDIRYALG